MTTNIQLLRSAVAQKRPQPANLLDGQAAINTNATEPGLFFKLSDNNLVKIGPVAISNNGTAPNAAAAGTAGNSVGETWLDGRAAFAGQSVLKVWNGANWIAANGFNVDDATGHFDLENELTVTALIANGGGNDSHITVPSDTTGNRPGTPVEGMIRYNTTQVGGNDIGFEGYANGAWSTFGTAGGDQEFDDLTVLVDLTVNGDTTLGNSCADDTLTVNSVANFNCDVNLGDTNADTITYVGRVDSDILPEADGTRSLGSAALRWANVFTNDLHLKNDRGDWTLIEEEEYLTVTNNKTGQRYKLSMEPLG